MSIGVLAIAYTRKRPVSETADALSRLNVPHIVVEDGDPRGLEADALVMIDSCRSFLRYPLMLAQPRARRPATAIWQIEVLPPKELDRSIEDMPVWHMLDKNRSRLSRYIKRWALYPFLSVVATPLGALRDTLVSLIFDDARRKEIAAACQGFVRENMTLDQSVERIVAWAESMTGNGNNPSDSEKCPQLAGHC